MAIHEFPNLCIGRGLWAMGTPFVHERRFHAALNNCAFVSTEGIDKDPTEPFCFLMDASMLGTSAMLLLHKPIVY